MQQSITALAVAAGLAASASIIYSPRGLQIALGKEGTGPHFAAEAFINAAAFASGIVRRLLANPHGELDALRLQGGTIVKFPPHMSKELVPVVKPSNTVSVRGFRETEGTIKAFVLTIEASKQQVIEALPEGLRFAMLTRLRVAAIVDRLLRGRQGEVNGVFLQDGTGVHYSPHAAFNFANWLLPGQVLAAKGLGTDNVYGRGLEAIAMGSTRETVQEVYGR
jgi:hypothetical protein